MSLAELQVVKEHAIPSPRKFIWASPSDSRLVQILHAKKAPAINKGSLYRFSLGQKSSPTPLFLPSQTVSDLNGRDRPAEETRGPVLASSFKKQVTNIGRR